MTAAVDGGVSSADVQRGVFEVHASQPLELFLRHGHRQSALAAADVVLQREDEERRHREARNHHHDHRDADFNQREPAFVVFGFHFSWHVISSVLRYGPTTTGTTFDPHDAVNVTE